MKVVFLAPHYPSEMPQYTRGLAEVGVSVHGIGDQPAAALPADMKPHLAGPSAASWCEQAIEKAHEAGAFSLARRLEEAAERDPRAAPTTEVRSRELELLLEVGRAISSMLELDPLLEEIMDALIESLNGERDFPRRPRSPSTTPSPTSATRSSISRAERVCRSNKPGRAVKGRVRRGRWAQLGGCSWPRRGLQTGR